MKEIEDFMRAIEDEEFVYGHEVLEDVWKKYKITNEDESYILKGLINASTALALYKMKRFDGSKRVWQTFLKYEPLIDTIPSKRTNFYKKARDLLHKTYDNLTAL